MPLCKPKPLTRTVTICCDELTADLWARMLLLATHERSTATARELFRRMMTNYRKAVQRRHPAGWVEDIEARFYRPKRVLATKAPPPAPDSFVD